MALVSCKEPEISEYDKERASVLNQNGWNIYTHEYEPIKTFEFPVYYSKIDTIHIYQSGQTQNPVLVFNHIEDDPVKIRMFCNNETFNDVYHYSKTKDETYNFWTLGERLNFSNIKLKTGDKFLGEVSYKEKKYSYDFTSVEKPIYTDVLGVKFGFTKEEVKSAEPKRMGFYYTTDYRSGFYEESLNLLKFNNAPSLNLGHQIFSTNTEYIFEENKLISVIEYVYIQYGSRQEEALKRLNEYSKKLGNKEQIEVDESGKLKNKIEWERYGINLTIVGRYPDNNFSYLGIKYKPVK